MHLLEMISFFFFFTFFIICSMYIFSAFFSRLRKWLEDLKWTLILGGGNYVLPSNSWHQSFSFWDLDAAQMLSAKIPDVPDCPAPVAHIWSVQYFKKHLRLQLSLWHAGPNPVKNWTEHLVSLCNSANLNLLMLCQAGTAYKVRAFFSLKILISNTISLTRHSDCKKVHQDGERSTTWACCADGMLTWSAEKD